MPARIIQRVFVSLPRPLRCKSNRIKRVRLDMRCAGFGGEPEHDTNLVYLCSDDQYRCAWHAAEADPEMLEGKVA